MNRWFSILVLAGIASGIYLFCTRDDAEISDRKPASTEVLVLNAGLVPFANPLEETSEDDTSIENEAYLQSQIKNYPGPESLYHYASFLFFNERFTEANRQLDECIKFTTCKTQAEIIKKAIVRIQNYEDPVLQSQVWLETRRDLGNSPDLW